MDGNSGPTGQCGDICHLTRTARTSMSYLFCITPGVMLRWVADGLQVISLAVGVMVFATPSGTYPFYPRIWRC